MQGALDGVRVVDLSRVLAGPFCTMMMGDLGADVIKVEPPSGDETRSWGPPYAGDLSAYYLTVNRNKRSVVLNLKTAEGQEVLHRLVRDADVVVENWRPGKAEQLGAGYDELRTLNPNLIYCSISGFGQDGPYRDLPGYDYVIQAMGGLMSITGEPDGPPLKVGVAVVDLFAGLFALSGILAALRAREMTGRGQKIDISLLDSQVAMLANVAMNYLIGGAVPKRLGNRHPNIVPYETFPARDGDIVVAVGNDKQFQRLCEALGHPEWATDSRFSSNGERVKHREALVSLLHPEFKKRTRGDWMKTLSRYDIPCGPIQTVDQVFQDPQVLFRQMLIHVTDREIGKVPLIGSPFKLSETHVTFRQGPPRFGEHTYDVLKEIGYSDTCIRDFVENGVVMAPVPSK